VQRQRSYDTLSKAIMDELGIERNKLREIFDKLE
jgi:hypothetical protein